ncbi:GAF domain-like protein [Eremomyces bilateralis CBS 781.70]|uniref:GAF domain-like protein n=1 Tax=Eremomyces bilateralis CBS 781.70 TaxID=1392243 RepID=A0A6G1GC07_9PEZI|nr:GAF domain-like protein [Eremomyces bilateralis CBS 781.70]KAF1815617.1 GAF domain-like protein [Eremomyces bilateralis CBS 781.70]
MVHHAEASTFEQGLSKAQAYARVLEEAEALFAGQRNWVSNLSNASSLLHHALKSVDGPVSAINWCGFYFINPLNHQELILGPFHGHVACQSIKVGQGVCGAAAATMMTEVVPNVDEFPGHIACDSNSKSEIVVPIIQNSKVVAIIDIDCSELNGFNSEDAQLLEKLANLIAETCDF